MDEAKFLETVRALNWGYAKTYYDKWPHEYILVGKQDEATFRALVCYIKNNGRPQRFYRARFNYLEIDGMVYWVMSDGKDMNGIINRTFSALTFENREKRGILPGDRKWYAVQDMLTSPAGWVTREVNKIVEERC